MVAQPHREQKFLKYLQNRILTMYLSWDTLQGQKEPQRNLKLHSLVLLLVLMLGVLLVVV